MSPRAHTPLAALAAFALLAGRAAVAKDANPAPDADEVPLAALTLALAAAPVPQLADPTGDAPTQEPRVDLAVTFAARSVVFDELPRIRMTFVRPGPVRAVWRVDRKNLPPRVEPGVEYRDVEVRLTLSSTLDEFESLIEDARSVADGLRVEGPAAPGSKADQPPASNRLRQRPRVAAQTKLNALNAERARVGLLPRKLPPGQGSTGPVSGAGRAPALAHGERAAPASVSAAAPLPASAVVAEPAPETVFRLIDVVLAAMRNRFPGHDVDGGESVRADTSLESLAVRVGGALVHSRLIGRAGELTVTVQTGTGSAQEAGTLAAAPVPSAAPAPSTPPRDGTSGYEDDPGLLSRWRTPQGRLRERRLEPSGTIVERQVDPPDGWQRITDVSRLTLVTQRRADDGRIVQVVQDVSGARVEVTRDPIGRLLQARVLAR